MMKTIQINGATTEIPSGAIAWKMEDPTEGARWVYDFEDADEISRSDQGLLVWPPECTICAAADINTPGEVQIDYDRDRDGLPARTVMACHECKDHFTNGG